VVTSALHANGVVELATLARSGLDESRHLGAAVVVGPDGIVLRSLGNPSALVFGRSSLKFFQAITVLRSGVQLAGAELVLASASHAGTPRHVEVVRGMLARAGLTEDHLQCPVDWPLDSASRAAAASGQITSGKSRITMNCSGKHAAFLLACVQNGWPVESYLEPQHPLQVLIRATVEEFTGSPVGHTGVDGCGAPVFATTLAQLATAIGRVTKGSDMDAAALVTAILAEPWALDGPGRANTVVIEQLGLIAKGGAEGVIVMGAPDGTAVALKMIDGSARATSLVALALLGSVGAISPAEAERVGTLVTEKVLGGGEVVGSIRPSALVLQR
jgi:L-asparaginase II